MSHSNYNDPPSVRMVAVPIKKLQLGWTHRHRGQSEAPAEGRARDLQCRRSGSDNVWIAF
jgi:hypothetical protein